MPEVEGFELDLSDLDGYPVAVAHGSLDPVIPVEFGRAAAERVRAAGADLLWRETPVPHTIDPRVLPELQAFVARSPSERRRSAARPAPELHGVPLGIVSCANLPIGYASASTSTSIPFARSWATIASRS